MAQDYHQGSNGYHNAVRDRMKILHDQIKDCEAKRDALEATIADDRRELDLLSQAYPELSDDGGHERLPLDKNFSRRQTAGMVVQLLKEYGRPMHYREIYKCLIGRGLAPPDSADPASAVLARFYNSPDLKRVKRGTYDLDKKAPTPEGFPFEIRKSQPNLLEHGTVQTASNSFAYTKPISFILMGERRAVAREWSKFFPAVCRELFELDEDTFRSLPDKTSDNGKSLFPWLSLEMGSHGEGHEIADSGIFCVGPKKVGADIVVGECKKILSHMSIDPDAEFQVKTLDRHRNDTSAM